MTGEIEFFRKRFVGGFNRQDVVNYISKLAKERNDYREAKEKAEQDIHALNDYIATLRVEIDAAKKEAREGREYKVAALDSALGTFAALESAFGSLCGELDSATQGVFAELEKARDTITALPAMLARAGDGIKGLQAACSAEKDAVAAFDATPDEGSDGGGDENYFGVGDSAWYAEEKSAVDNTSEAGDQSAWYAEGQTAGENTGNTENQTAGENAGYNFEDYTG